MPDPSDLAATLRRLVEETGMGEAGDEPWYVDHQGGVFGRGVRIADGLDNEDADFIAWCRNNAEAVASALERGAAAEKVIAAQRVLEQPAEYWACVSAVAQVEAHADCRRALAAYTALKETDNG